MTTFTEFVESCTAADVLTDGKLDVRCVKSDACLTVALEELKVVSSLPVLNATTGKAEGMIDELDILAYALDAGRTDDQTDLEAIASLSTSTALVSNAINQSQKDWFLPVNPDTTLSLLVDLMAEGLHRSVIVDRMDNPLSIVTQTDVVRFFLKNLDRLSGLAHKSLTDLNMAKKHVETVKGGDQTLSVLRNSMLFGLRAVPIVDDDGRVVGNFSAQDVKSDFSQTVESLELSVSEFLQKTKSNPTRVESCSPDDTLAEVMDMMARVSVHRLWVCEEDRVVGVVSFTDIIGRLKYADV
eukprot:TRINITY_DN1812_c2_g1_i1.p1 TRINITY_DN1812_c2_g1~~TRINITY_DN1812_c2_g1_i1.p1  ORF type:complete len:298 (+),score=58.81 TRINITY_DN1812_c2_g1_i1:325-1218(+)